MSIGCVSHLFQDVSFFSTIVFDIVVVDFNLSLPVGDRIYWSDDSGTINWLLGLGSSR